MRRTWWTIWLAILTVILVAGNIGETQGSYGDNENSGNNMFQVWVSILSRQTTQTDFDAGVLISVDTSSSPGDVKLAAKSDWYSTSWTRRRPITITNSTGTTLSEFQVKVTVSYDSDMRGDFADIRFTNNDGTSLLSYWTQSYVASTSAIFWVKIPSIPSGTKTIYMYYGNPVASSTSNGWNTFDFFDDFSAGLSQWTIDAENTDKVYISAGAGNPSPSLRHDPDSSQTKNSYFDTRLITKDYKILNGVIEYEVYLAGTQRIIHQLGWRVQSLNFENGYCWRLQTATADGGHLRFTGRTSWSTFGTAFNYVSANTWHNVKEVVSGSTYTGYVDGGSAYSGTDSTKLTADYLVSHVHGVSLNASSYVLVDNIRVRKYASPEPITGLGSEEDMYTSSGTIASQILDTGVAGARWDALFWDETLQSNTNITFEVRADDALFVKDAVTPSWIAVGGISPVTSALPFGRYKQWRAILTTSDASKTPLLHEVRVYHY